MNAAWVAGTVRARALVRRRLGAGGARALLGAGSLRAAMEVLARSPYGHRDEDSGVWAKRAQIGAGDAGRGVAAALLWNVRVLAGWLPARGSELLRVLAGWFEIANVEEHLRALAGLAAPPPFQLGSLATAWPRLAATGTPEELRRALAASPWRDPGGASPRDIQIGMRLAWADRVAARAPAARPWALAAAALLVAREVLARGEPLPEPARQAAQRTLGPGAAIAATSVPQLRHSLPRAAAWVLDGIDEPGHLWRAEAAWWRRLRTDCLTMAARSGFGEEPVIGAVGLLAHDAWLVTAALGGVGRGPEAVEVFDAISA